MTTWTPARLLRLALWLVALGTPLTGLILLLNRDMILWEPVPGTEDTSSALVIDVTGVGLALLCTGILALVLTLIAEAVLVRFPASAAPPAPAREVAPAPSVRAAQKAAAERQAAAERSPSAL